MPTPAVAVRIKKLRRRFGIAAPRVTVKTYFPWHWYGLGLGFIVALVAVAVWTVARQSNGAGLSEEVRVLRQELAERNEELIRLRAGAATEQSTVQMERTARHQLVSRIKTLEAENAGLREENSLFERLVKDCPRKPGAGKNN